MPKRKAGQERKPYAFSEDVVVSAADLGIDPQDDTIAERLDGPSGVDPPPKKTHKRKIKSKPLRMSAVEEIEFLAVFAPLWNLHLDLEAKFPRNPIGRPREFEHIDLLLLWLASWVCGSKRKAEDTLADPKNWKRLRKAVKRAYPDDKSYRLSKSAPSRDQYNRMRDKIAEQPGFEKLQDKIDAVCVLIAVAIGLLNRDGPFSTPSTTDCIVSDGIWISARWKARIDQAFDPDTGKQVLMCDTEALQYTRNSEGEIVRRPGYHAVIAAVRGTGPGERVPLSIRLLDQPTPDDPQSECTLAIDMVFKLMDRIEGAGGKLVAFIYDMAMHQGHRDRLLDQGIIPVGKVQRTKGGKYAYRNLGKHRFKLADGTEKWLLVEAADGTPAVAFHDSKGNKHYARLKRRKSTREHQAKRIVVWGHWRIPDDDRIPPKLRKATALICHNSSPEEITNGYRRTRALSVLPETDPASKALLGLRQDIESLNGDLKARLPGGRAGTTGRNRLLFELAGYQLYTAIKALICFMRRHGLRRLEEWFGDHKYPLRKKRKR